MTMSKVADHEATIITEPPVRGRSYYRNSLAGALIYGIACALLLFQALIVRPGDVFQIDLEVYREAAGNFATGEPIYDWLTGAPQYLPFTYPPFAAIIMIPLALVSFPVAGWVWSLLQMALLWFCTGVIFRRFLEGRATRARLYQGLIATALLQLQPLQDGINLGQINSVIVTLTLLDIACRTQPPRRWMRWWPTGSLVGIVTAIKLTPAVFWAHFLISKQWKALLASLSCSAFATGLAWLLSPGNSSRYWLDVMNDPGRLGPNEEAANQSLRGVLLRVGHSWSSPVQSLSWMILVALICCAGFYLSAKFFTINEPLAVVAVVGMVAALISPVSWNHHWHWAIVAIGVFLAEGRTRTGWIWACAVYAGLMIQIYPASGWGSKLGAAGIIPQNAYAVLALAILFGLWWMHREQIRQAPKDSVLDDLFARLRRLRSSR